MSSSRHTHQANHGYASGRPDYSTFPTVEARKPGNNAPIFHGVRVVEMASMVAAPSVTRVLSDLGTFAVTHVLADPECVCRHPDELWYGMVRFGRVSVKVHPRPHAWATRTAPIGTT